jgi:hypothetical protein
VGGHSAGGQAAMQALPALLESRIIPNTTIVAFLGLDPFNAKSAHVNISIPAMYWGFTKTTCLVAVQYAAQYAYQHSTSKKRVFYQVANDAHHSTDIITHCIFTDHGCNLCPSNNNEVDIWVRIAIGKSVNRFIAAIASNGEFRDDDFLLKEYNDVNVYVDGHTIQRAIPSFEEVHYDNVSTVA